MLNFSMQVCYEAAFTRECPRRPRENAKMWHMVQKMNTLIFRSEIPHDELINVVYCFVQIYFCFLEFSQKLYKMPTTSNMADISAPSINTIACVASVPVPRERNMGRPKEFFRIRAARKMRREQKSGRIGVGEGKRRERLLANPSILKNAHWFSLLRSFID